jgi:hypothetical protein
LAEITISCFQKLSANLCFQNGEKLVGKTLIDELKDEALAEDGAKIRIAGYVPDSARRQFEN